MKALIIGATGATGKDLVDVLLEDPDYSRVVTFVRQITDRKHPKLHEVATDFENLAAVAAQVDGKVLFCCLGTTAKAAGSKDAQRHIDYEIPLHFAAIAKSNGVEKLVLLSAYGADAKSRVFYSRLKGELEDQLTALGFDQLGIFRPGLLLREDTDRWGERISAGVLSLLNSIGIVRRFRPLPTRLLAQKLAKAPVKLPPGKQVIELGSIFNF